MIQVMPTRMSTSTHMLMTMLTATIPGILILILTPTAIIANGLL
jgi:hypothetical protein